MRVLILGATGLVGNAVYRFAEKSYEVYGTYFNQKKEGLYYLDISDAVEVSNLISKIKPNIIVHSAALPAVDYCEDNHDEAWKINVDGTNNICLSAKKINSKVVFISTDYVFDGKNGPYSEEEKPNPISFYGKIKLEGENTVKKLSDYLIIRTTGVYGIESAKKNFVIRLINNNKIGEIARVPIDQYGSPTFSDNIGESVIKLCENNKTGIYNVAGSEVINRYEFALKVAEVFGLNKDLIKPMKTSELNQKAPRPLYAGLKIDKIRNEINVKLVSSIEGLNIMKSQLAKIN